MSRIGFISLAALLICLNAVSAVAQSMGSSYTSTAPKDCRQIGKPSELDGSTIGKVITREPTLEDAYVELVQTA